VPFAIKVKDDATKLFKQIFNQLTVSFVSYTPTFLKLLRILELKLISIKREINVFLK